MSGTETPVPAGTYELTVLLSQDFRATYFGYDPEAPYAEAGVIGFTVTEPTTVGGLLENVFCITNSYPEELHCDPSFAATVASYRAAGNRSLSVGDAVRFAETTFAVESFGFKAVA